MTRPLKLKINELEIPYSGQRFKGRIFSGNPSRGKPRGMPLNEWCASIIDLIPRHLKARVCIPDSFFPNREMWRNYFDGNEISRYLSLTDDLGSIGECRAATPAEDIGAIVDCLKNGDDVVILSQTTKVSGFVPAIIVKMFEPNCHIVKILYPIEHCGYELTAGQRGYLAGLSDAERLQWIFPKSSDVDSE